MAYTFCPTCKLRESPSTMGVNAAALDLNHRQIVRAVSANDCRAIFLAIVQRDFHLPGVGDHMIVGENVTFFIDDETGALAFLRHQAIEEIKSDGARSDVDH